MATGLVSLMLTILSIYLKRLELRISKQIKELEQTEESRAKRNSFQTEFLNHELIKELCNKTWYPLSSGKV